MDTDSNDATASESLNGETKPDAAKLAQTAIIKQDVMLSATTSQSPLATASSVFTMPTVSLPNVSMASAAGLGLTDHLFMSVSSASDTASSAADHHKHESNGLHALSNPAQLLGQPQVAPQFFLAGQSAASAAAAAGTGQLPIQQLLIPVSTGNGTQQFISIPVSMATGSNQQIQLLTTSNGQIVATNLSSLQALAQPLNLGLPAASLANPVAAHSGHSQHTSLTGATSHISHIIPSQLAAALPQLLTASAQSQLLAVNSQNAAAVRNLALDGKLALDAKLLQSAVSAAHASLSSTSHQSAAASGHTTNHINHSQSAAAAILQQTLNTAAVTGTTAHSVVTQQNTRTPSLTSAQVATTTNGFPPSVSQLLPNNSPNDSVPVCVHANVATPITAVFTKSLMTNAGLPPSIAELLPDTVGNSTESTTVDGINLDEIKEFARQFKIRRLSLGLTQTQVGQALSATEGPAYSQSAICRFEKLDITPKSAQKIKPVLERWMLEAEERYKNGVQNLTDFIGSEPSKKRKRRTSFTPQALEVLNQYFERNTHPSGSEMTELADKLSYDREVIRVWFCNKRQALKNTIKKLKQETGP
ncbi:POU domain, class 6, transcription factor 2-like [Gigantopelta aegis]|uniref:POU domain, class 6, transcription factor 2-like n=1 Tax=Gigantopelta aegis TaxID=1735272 RepID=UPI001B88C75C|nr:POU domain, class 6, transcription factor 2-like [Gigantopelta aegis]